MVHRPRLRWFRACRDPHAGRLRRRRAPACSRTATPGSVPERLPRQHAPGKPRPAHPPRHRLALRSEGRAMRSLLFAPGNHPRRVEKALTLAADGVILDLEDAVAVSEKVTTRATVVDAFGPA